MEGGGGGGSMADTKMLPPTTPSVSSSSRSESGCMEHPQERLWMEVPADASDEEVSGLLDWFRFASSPEPPMQGWPGGDVR